MPSCIDFHRVLEGSTSQLHGEMRIQRTIHMEESLIGMIQLHSIRDFDWACFFLFNLQRLGQTQKVLEFVTITLALSSEDDPLI